MSIFRKIAVAATVAVMSSAALATTSLEFWLDHPETMPRRAILTELGVAPAELVAIARAEDRLVYHRVRAAAFLETLGGEAARKALRALAVDERIHREVRVVAIDAVAAMEGKASLSFVSRFVVHPDRALRSAAYRSLFAHAGAAERATLTERLGVEPDPHLKAQLQRRLSATGR